MFTEFPRNQNPNKFIRSGLRYFILQKYFVLNLDCVHNYCDVEVVYLFIASCKVVKLQKVQKTKQKHIRV